ncbi:YchJ family protein [Pusillimonas sp. T7-7]|uniref:YchJ family protein n=1 Tax=Pusillimonas sp. (strain T7-7) TaxID=1007105 RepID=UPI0011D2311F|nr:YchJ family metal-binding protein [Pusillimonas sp. T7-7]
MKQAIKSSTLTPCPCGNNASYQACCGRWHHGELRLKAPDAATLMRSRYTAFVLDELDYLLETWHASTRPASLEGNAPGVKWLGLQLRSHVQQDADHATVEFVARSRHQGRAARLHEISRFVCENGQWFYVDGDFVQKAS